MCSDAAFLGDLGASHHRIRDVVAVGAEISHIERFAVIPVVSFQAEVTTTPRTASRPGDQPKLFSQSRGVPRGTRADASRTEQIQGNLNVAAKTGDLGMLAVAARFLHGFRDLCAERVATLIVTTDGMRFPLLQRIPQARGLRLTPGHFSA